MKNTYINLVLIFLSLLILSGCLYPKSELSKNNMSNDKQLESIQLAVMEFKNETGGLMPIKTKSNDVAIYEKYLIDFSMLKDHQLISEIPGNAYENGGVYQYTIITPEDNPRVKLIDLRITEKIREVNVKLNNYRNKNLYPPFGEQVSEGMYKLNYEKLRYKSEPYVVSPFSNVNLPIIINTDGELFIDYRIDLQRVIDEFDHDLVEGEDIREILPHHFPFVPVYSVPYTIRDNEPVFLLKE